MYPDAKQEAVQANTEIQEATMALSHYQNELKVKQKDLGSNSSDYERDKNNLDAMEKEVGSLEVKLIFL